MATRSQNNSVVRAAIVGIHANNTIWNLVNFLSIYWSTVNIIESLRARASTIWAVFLRVFCTICSNSWWICRSSRSSASDVSNKILNFSEKKKKNIQWLTCLFDWQEVALEYQPGVREHYSSFLAPQSFYFDLEWLSLQNINKCVKNGNR